MKCLPLKHFIGLVTGGALKFWAAKAAGCGEPFPATGSALQNLPGWGNLTPQNSESVPAGGTR